MSRPSDDQIAALLETLPGADEAPLPPLGPSDGAEHCGEDELRGLQRDELDSARRGELEAHLARCPYCRELAAELARPADPAALHAARRLRAEGAPRRRGRGPLVGRPASVGVRDSEASASYEVA